MSDGMQNLAGDKLRKVIAAITNNRFMAVIVGVISTVIVQSSSVTTVMVIGFVNAGLMTLVQALGVIIGANVGTTVTGWVLVLQIGKYGLPMAGFGALILLFAKKDKTKYQAMMIMGLGLVFFGLELMKDGFKPIRNMPEFLELFQKFEVTDFTSVLIVAAIGALLTAIVQSSSATLGITITLATQHLISYKTGVALVLGLNVGTTITALLASIGAKSNAKRAAIAHTTLNIIGIIWILPLYWWYLDILKHFADPMGNITKYLAVAHTGFNLLNGLLFIPFVGYLASALVKLIPEAEEKVKKYTQLDIRMVETPTVALEQSKIEIEKMGNRILEMIKVVENIFKEKLDRGSEYISYIFEEEDNLDLVQKEISDIVTGVLKEDISQELTIEAKNQLAYADEHESISDYYTHLVKLHLKLKDKESELDNAELKDLLVLHKQVEDFFKFSLEAYKNRVENFSEETIKRMEEVTFAFKSIRDSHLNRLKEQNKDVFYSTTYIDMLNTYRRIKTHVYHECEVMAGEKAI
jgi:phosphate:Na+ symporter